MSLKKNHLKIILAFIAGLLLITPGYYKNAWQAVETQFYSDWQQVFEPPVIGRLAKSAQDGPFSAGGLLGLGDFEVAEGENVSVEVWMAPGKVVDHQYEVYLNNETFTSFATYNSAPGFQGILFSLFDQFTALSPNLNLKIFRFSVALLTAFTFCLLFAWFAVEFGLLSMLLGILFAAFSLWLTLLGGNLYWNLWAFYLPLIVVLFLINQFSKNGRYSAVTVNLVLLITGIIKVLFNGFEFVTTAWVMYSVPLVYYAVRDRWAWADFLKRMFSFVGILALVTAIGLLILATQVASVEGGFGPAAASILDALNRRSTGDPSQFSGVFQEALQANLGGVLWKYTQFPTITLPGVEIPNPFLNAIAHLPYWVWIVLFAIVSIVLILRFKRSNWTNQRQGLALLAATWYSALAPLSWLILFKAHAYIHVRLAPVIWQMPFIFFGLALIGFVISNKPARTIG